jgi:hypothetical protein
MEGDISRMRLKKITKTTSLPMVLLIVALLIFGCGTDDLKKGDLKTEYQGVLLTSGQGYFGKIENIGTRFIEMTDVYYIHSQQKADVKEPQYILIKRGKEFHAPDRMYINVNQVLVMEPVAPDSKVAQLIKETKAK